MLEDEDEILCDLAEYYGITSTEELSVQKLAALCFGLPKESRTIRKIANQKLTLTEQLLAIIADRLGLLIWCNTEDAKHNRNRPVSILSELTKDKEDKPLSFNTKEDFKKEWERIIRR